MFDWVYCEYHTRSSHLSNSIDLAASVKTCCVLRSISIVGGYLYAVCTVHSMLSNCLSTINISSPKLHRLIPFSAGFLVLSPPFRFYKRGLKHLQFDPMLVNKKSTTQTCFMITCPCLSGFQCFHLFRVH